MKKFKILTILICLLITGCRAECVIKINGEEIEENVYYIVEKQNLIDNDIQNNISKDIKKYSGGYKDSVEGFTVKSKIEYTKTEDAIELSNKYNSFNEFSQSLLLNACYDLAKISKYDEDSYNITTSNVFKCFNIYEQLDKVDLIIETNNKVLYTNSDSKKGNKYIWNINKNNYNDKKISITISKTADNQENKKKSYKEIIILIGGLVLVVLTFGVAIIIRNKKVNRI